jgi:UDP-N-acetylglucosamine acyltransferase
VIIHPLSEVSPNARLGVNVEIGPFAIIEDDTQIGDRCVIAGRVTIKRGTTLGCDNRVGEGAVLGGLPQHLNVIEFPGQLIVGNRNVIRENVTMHRAMVADHSTSLGDDCLVMVGAHLAHDVVVGNHVVLTNNVMLAGHVSVGDRAYLGGGAAVHQYCRVGRNAMVGGLARIVQDVPPFMMIDGESNQVVGLNKVGLRRAGMTSVERNDLKEAYQLLYRQGYSWDELLATLEERFTTGPAAEIAPFLRDTTRGYLRERRTPPKATIRLLRDEPGMSDDADIEPIRKVG